MRRSFTLFVTIHSTRAVPFTLSRQHAVEALETKYSSRYIFGAKKEFIEYKTPSAEYIPFFLCNGQINASFTATVEYRSNSRDSKGNSVPHTNRTTTDLLELHTTYHENQTQIYGGYKYNNRNIYHVLRDEQNAVNMLKISEVDVSVASINLFEVSVTTLGTLLRAEVGKQARDLAESQVRRYHSMASSITIHFQRFEVTLDNVYPCFLPCYVVAANYDENTYTMYVNGASGKAGGPYLINSLAAARLAATTTLSLALILSPSKVMGLVTGSFLGVAAYYISFFASKKFPAYRRDYFRKQREKDRAKYVEEDVKGYRPTEKSQRRVTEEYEKSTFWSNHKFDQKSCSANVKDTKGYYALLHLKGDESVNEIRSAFRQRVLMEHPDAGGTTERMTKLNEAYKVLRDPALRAKYDKE